MATPTSYAAFIRGIMPMNPNTRNDKLKALFESLGYANVRPVISSGNVIFESEKTDAAKLESEIEAAMSKKLSFINTVFIRSQKELERIVKKDPFKGTEHGKKSYLLVTFLKKKPHELYIALDMTDPRTPDYMREAEKKYSKEITSRTWKTVQRILAKMQA